MSQRALAVWRPCERDLTGCLAVAGTITNSNLQEKLEEDCVGWLHSPERIREPSKSRFAFLLIGAVAFAFTEFGRFVCRPYVRSHGIDDFGITDSIGNLGGIVVMIFLGCAALNPTKQQSFRLAAFYSVGFVVYEFLQPVLPRGVFDWMDVFGTAIGYLFSLAILATLWSIVPTREDSEFKGG